MTTLRPKTNRHQEENTAPPFLRLLQKTRFRAMALRRMSTCTGRTAASTQRRRKRTLVVLIRARRSLTSKRASLSPSTLKAQHSTHTPPKEGREGKNSKYLIITCIPSPPPPPNRALPLVFLIEKNKIQHSSLRLGCLLAWLRLRHNRWQHKTSPTHRFHRIDESTFLKSSASPAQPITTVFAPENSISYSAQLTK